RKYFLSFIPRFYSRRRFHVYSSCDHLALHSFPTRRSSDLYVGRDFQRRGAASALCDVLERACPVRPVTTHASRTARGFFARRGRSEEHTSELQSRFDLVCRLLLEKKNYEIV